jgi:hypothetical protein
MGIIKIPTEEDSKPFRAGSHSMPITPFPPGINGQTIIHHALIIEEEATHLTRLMCPDGWPTYQSLWTSIGPTLRPNKDKEVSEASEEVLEPMPSKQTKEGTMELASTVDNKDTSLITAPKDDATVKPIPIS